MTTGRYREEVFNVLLALLLHERGVVTAPEQSFRQAFEKHRGVPDVLVVFRGLRTVIEGKVDESPDAAERALSQAQQRVDKGIAHIGIAVVYPATLRKVPFADLPRSLAGTRFTIAVCSEAGTHGWTEGNVDYLADILRRTFEQLIEEDVVTKAAELLDAGVTEFSRTCFTSPTIVSKGRQILGIGEPPKRKKSADAEDED